MRRSTLALAGAFCLSTSTIAVAQTDTIFGAPGAMVMNNGSIYLSIAPQFTSFGQPVYNLGFTAASGALFTDQGAVVEHRQRVNAGGATVALGFVLNGLPPNLGWNPRVELAGTFLQSSSEGDFRTVTAQGGTQLVNGLVADFGCNPCDWTSRLQRQGRHFRLNLMVASDFPVAQGVFLTPSVGVFGSHTRIRDNLFQTFAGPGGTPGVDDIYTADSTTRWSDIGGRAKLIVTFNLTPAIQVFGGGHADFAYRRAHFEASDFYGGGPDSSSISGSASRFNFAVGGQAGASYNEGNWLIISVIGGVDYDNKVPRIQRPSTTNFVTTNGTIQTPAHLAFSSAVNFAGQIKLTLRLF